MLSDSYIPCIPQNSIRNREQHYPLFDIEHLGGTNRKQYLTSEPMKTKSRLIHPSLQDVSQDLRYFACGAMNTVGFMLFLTMANLCFHETYSASSIYSFSSFIFIPIGHATSSLTVFGWPDKYFQNLAMNAPIGVSATLIGSLSTEYLDRVGFDSVCYGALRSVISSLDKQEDDGDDGNIFSTILVMIVTGIWGYLLSNFVNSNPKPKKIDKEL
mmetsp:Transcript_258/g.274  ORF Transcript_258/g.274 Transcript_258/m.274 type:complete len:214 (-) Transcript_258:230-871(-)